MFVSLKQKKLKSLLLNNQLLYKPFFREGGLTFLLPPRRNVQMEPPSHHFKDHEKFYPLSFILYPFFKG